MYATSKIISNNPCIELMDKGPSHEVKELPIRAVGSQKVIFSDFWNNEIKNLLPPLV